MPESIYVLGTGLSHNGSAVLLKDGKVCVGIEKERLSRVKHDGGNDTAAIEYCLSTAGITLDQVSLVVQCANFEVPHREYYLGPRLFSGNSHPPLVSISHHLAHAYSAAGTCPYSDSVIMVIDGCGSPIEQCTDLGDRYSHLKVFEPWPSNQMLCEKDSYYYFDGKTVTPILKDFSEMSVRSGNALDLATTRHSIGGFYSAISNYIFGNLDDVGKLMGLAPYGRVDTIDTEALYIEDDRVFVSDLWQPHLQSPCLDYTQFKHQFQHYADVAFWAQQEIEQAIHKCISSRLAYFPHANLSYAGGVALNAVANAKLLDSKVVENLYIVPAAGDNGLALGCAYYGWLELLNKKRQSHNKSSCFGRNYTNQEIEYHLESLHPADYHTRHIKEDTYLLEEVAKFLASGKTVAWFQAESEFGPRALGRRSILAHPGIEGIGDHINSNIKFREDFRPFAPAVLKNMVGEYFENGYQSPYMILIDKTKDKYRESLSNVTHVDGTARVQTVDEAWNPRFAALLRHFHALTGLGVLLNTSFNKKGMPIVEKPIEAIDLFQETALDVLVIENFLITKRA